jgi:hypothetical protein
MVRNELKVVIQTLTTAAATLTTARSYLGNRFASCFQWPVRRRQCLIEYVLSLTRGSKQHGLARYSVLLRASKSLQRATARAILVSGKR